MKMKQWKSLIWITVGIAAVRVFSVLTAKPLLAQARAALVQDVLKFASQNISFISQLSQIFASLHVVGKDGQ